MSERQHVIPFKGQESEEPTSVNGDNESGERHLSEKATRKQDIILITGKEDSCQAAKEAIMVGLQFFFQSINLICFSVKDGAFKHMHVMMRPSNRLCCR